MAWRFSIQRLLRCVRPLRLQHRDPHEESAGLGSYFWFGGPGAVPNANCQKLMRAIADAQAQIRELQDNLKTAGPTQKGGIGAQILKWRRVLEAAQEAARKNFCI